MSLLYFPFSLDLERKTKTSVPLQREEYNTRTEWTKARSLCSLLISLFALQISGESACGELKCKKSTQLAEGLENKAWEKIPPPPLPLGLSYFSDPGPLLFFFTLFVAFVFSRNGGSRLIRGRYMGCGAVVLQRACSPGVGCLASGDFARS